MQKDNQIEQIERILNVFSEYLQQQKSVEFIKSKKFGYLCVSSWEVGGDFSYDTLSLESVDQLCEILADVVVCDMLALMEENCLNEEDSREIYYNAFQKYVLQLPEYRDVLNVKFAKTILPLLCRNE